MGELERTLDLGGGPGAIGRAHEAVSAFCVEAGLGEADADALHLAVEEIVANVVEHGYRGEAGRHFALAFSVPRAGWVRAVVEDDAPEFNPLAWPVADVGRAASERPVGGLGLHLVRSVMGYCRYERREGRNVFAVDRRVGGEGAAPLRVACSRAGARADVSLGGALEGQAAADLGLLWGEIAAPGVERLAIDLRGVSACGPEALRGMAEVAREMAARGGRTEFAGASPGLEASLAAAGAISGRA